METLKYLLIEITVKPYRTAAYGQEKKGIGKVISTHDKGCDAYNAAQTEGLAEDTFTVILGSGEIKVGDVVSFGSSALSSAER